MLRCVSRLPFSLSDSVVYFCVIVAKKGSFCGPCTLWVLRRFLSSCFLSSRHPKIPISVTHNGCSSAILHGHHYLEVCTALANVVLSNEAEFRHSTPGFLASKGFRVSLGVSRLFFVRVFLLETVPVDFPGFLSMRPTPQLPFWSRIYSRITEFLFSWSPFLSLGISTTTLSI
jgi:hypothetical protein